MCLGIPGQITEIENNNPLMRMGTAQFGQLKKEICLAFTPDVQIGDYVLVHVGFAITKLDEVEAQRIFAALDEAEVLDEIPG